MSAARRSWVKICGVTRPADAEAAARLGADLLGLNFWPGSPRHVEVTAAREIADAARGCGEVRLVGVFVNETPSRVDEIAAELELDLVQLHGDEPEAEAARWGARLVRVVRGDFFFSGPDSGEGGLPTRVGDDADALERLALKGERAPGVAAGGGRGRFGARRSMGEAAEVPSGSRLLEAREASGLSLQQNASVAVSPPRAEVPPFAYLLDAPRRAVGRGAYGGLGAAWDWGAARAWVTEAARPVLVAGGVRPENAAAAMAASGADGVDVASGVESAPGIKELDKMRRLFEEVRGNAT